MVNLLCEHSELFSETWPTSGTMLDGKVYALPTQAHLTTDSEFLSSHTLRTPSVIDSTGGAKDADKAAEKGNHVKLQDQMATLAKNNGLKVSNSLMPTPSAAQEPGFTVQPVDKDGTEPHEREGIVQTDTVARAVFNSGQISFLATPQARDSKGRPGRDEDKNLNHDVARHDLITDWGKFEPAIRRWESILGRPAPAPTKPDGKDGAHRLSSEFTEWMMGVPAGWITGVGLSRNDELKACGNGVVPQQAELALRMLLEGVETTAGGG